MLEFSGEVLAVIMVFLFVVILATEYLWLYLLSKRNEEITVGKKKISNHIENLFEAVLYAAGEKLRKEELDSLADYIKNDYDRTDAAATHYIELIDRDEIPENRKQALDDIRKIINPEEFYKNLLTQKNRYKKCYAMRRLADFNVKESVDDIKEYVDSKKLDLSYNAAMALSKMGEEEAVLDFMKKCEKNKNYSHRVMLECLQIYSGDKSRMMHLIKENCNEYILSSAIKAYMSEELTDCSDIYKEAISSKNTNLKIAAIKALAQLGNAEDEQKFNIALHDKNWIVRLAAVSGLEKIATETALESLVSATQDEEWWVRNAAAKAIVNKDFYFTYVERVLGGYDKYAADAVKDALYKQVNMNGGPFR